MALPHAVATQPSKTTGHSHSATYCHLSRRKTLTQAQRRLIAEIRSQGGADGGAEYWPVVNDWVKDCGAVKSLALRNITRSVEALIRDGYITLDDEGLLHVKP